MRKLLASACVVAAFATAGMTAFADNVGIPFYTRGPRIIHVPQPGEELRDSQASLRSADPQGFDDDAASSEPQRRAVKPAVKAVRPKAKSVATVSTHRDSTRRRPYNVSLPEPPPPPPEPMGPRRALLSAPPPPLPSIHDGPTPLRATPRFGQPLPEPV
ncbi:MAG: hypothetical protein JSR61_11565, partial [Proteobacteria bacterium]|nr:hypothetical protein [Pseudomonadota bacterium]